MQTIQQQYIGSAGYEEICRRVEPLSRVEFVSDVTKDFDSSMAVQKASKLKKSSDSGAALFVLEAHIDLGEERNKVVCLVMSKDFSKEEGVNALSVVLCQL